VEAIKGVVKSGGAVIACAYPQQVPQEIRDQLPTDKSFSQFVARIENGRVVQIIRGLPEEAILKALPAAR